MPAIGVSLRKWTLLLLFLCSTPTSAYSQPANDDASDHAGTTAASSTTTQHATPLTTPTSLTPSPKPASRVYPFEDATCPFLTINYITHTLPQQCAKTSWIAPSDLPPANQAGPEVEATPSLDGHATGSTGEEKQDITSSTTSQASENASVDDTKVGGTPPVDAEIEHESDSPLDNSNFLSFEEWKKRNLAQVGQSPEHVGQGRASPSNQAARRRPVNVNALDSLGEEGEIEIDFTGFGSPTDGQKRATIQPGTSDTALTEAEKKAALDAWALSKDAGKTCKERFNYASFDCAATVLKTNKQAKSATSILVENKDSYMLNECSANNKFFIIELCDDILVDTVVLANYEFFSSMFRHFRVSVSDRYPVKMERWRTLGTFEARNSRDIQPFLVTEPQIWARYLRIEFLTHYGNEFYCPLSLLRVHGTTMIGQFMREQEEAHGVEDDVDLEAAGDVVKPGVGSGPIPVEQVPIQPPKDDGEGSQTQAVEAEKKTAQSDTHIHSDSVEQRHNASQTTSLSTGTPASEATGKPGGDGNTNNTDGSSVAMASSSSPSSNQASTDVVSSQSSQSTQASPSANVSSSTPVPESNSATNTSAASQSKTVSEQDSSVTTPSSTKVPSAKVPDSNVAGSVQSPSQRASGTQSSPPTPPTQESFFKSIHKRLQYLEANSTLSLQYIEEQSRILRDAFMKVEKRQLAKTEKFLDHLNSTVMQELKSFRTMYDQLWQSTVIELESMKERQKTEMGEIGTRLTLMADELVWQKRMAVVQSTLLLLCLGLVLFVRSGTLSSPADVPIVQQLGSKYTSFFESSPPHSPPESGIARRRRTFRDMWRSDTSVGLSDPQSDGGAINPTSDAEIEDDSNPIIEYSPATPSTLAQSDLRNHPSLRVDIDSPTSPEDDQAKRLEVLETQSGPATPNGTRDCRPSWEEVDRAIEELNAETQQHQEKTSSPQQQQGTRHTSTISSKRDTNEIKRNLSTTTGKKKRSPLRRAQNSYELTDENGNVDGHERVNGNGNGNDSSA